MDGNAENDDEDEDDDETEDVGDCCVVFVAAEVATRASLSSSMTTSSSVPCSPFELSTSSSSDNVTTGADSLLYCSINSSSLVLSSSLRSGGVAVAVAVVVVVDVGVVVVVVVVVVVDPLRATTTRAELKAPVNSSVSGVGKCSAIMLRMMVLQRGQRVDWPFCMASMLSRTAQGWQRIGCSHSTNIVLTHRSMHTEHSLRVACCGLRVVTLHSTRGAYVGCAG